MVIEVHWIGICITLIVGFVLIKAYDIYYWIFGKNLKMEDYECRLVIDDNQQLFYEWLQTDTQQNVSFVTGDMWGNTKTEITLDKMQNAPWIDYPPRFPSIHDIDNDFHFRTGKLINVDRFDVVLMSNINDRDNKCITFGHIEFVFQESFALKKQVIWLFCVYVAPQFRGQKLGKILINKSLDYCYKDKRVEEVHLIVEAENVVAFNLYKTCGFKEYKRANDKKHDMVFIVMKHEK